MTYVYFANATGKFPQRAALSNLLAKLSVAKIRLSPSESAAHIAVFTNSFFIIRLHMITMILFSFCHGLKIKLEL